jgi:hypothetical protein
VRRALLLGAIAAVAGLAIPATASAANPSIVNTGGGCSGQTSWLVSCAAAGETENNGNILRVSALVSHDLPDTIPSLLTDDDWDGTNDAGTVRSVSAEHPTVAGGYAYSRANLSYTFPTSNTGMSCPLIGTRTRRTDNRNARIAARSNQSETSGTSSSIIKFVAAGQCTGSEDFAYIYSWGANNFVNSTALNPGESKTFTYTGDDKDTTGDSDFNGVFWRTRNLRTGAVSGGTLDCDNNGDNAQKSTTVTFPDRGAFVVEAELRDGGGCGQQQNNGYWFPLGTADVNGAAAATLNATVDTNRPPTNGNVQVTGAFGADPDSADGGRTEILEWDLDNNGSFDSGATDRAATPEAGLTSPISNSINTTGMTPGTKTVTVKLTDNGAMAAADNIRRTTTDTVTYTVNSIPTANGQTITTDTNVNTGVTLTGADANSDPLSFNPSDPADGSVSPPGSGPASRTYTPDPGFAGDDSFTFTANDGFNGTSSAATVIAKVRPDTLITAAPAPIDNDNDPSIAFDTNATAVPITFQCSVDNNPTFSACSSPFNFTDLPDGDHNLRVRAVASGVGNVDPTPAQTNFSIDTVAPSASIDDGPPDPSNDTTPEFDLSSNEANVDFECKLDGGAFTPCAENHEITPALEDDVHTLEVKAIDPAGNDSTTDSFTWRSDATDPHTDIESAPSDPTSDPDAAFDFTSNELGGFECRLDSTAPGDFDPCAAHTEFEDLAPGEHTLDVRSADLAGNVDESPASYEWTIDSTSAETSIDSTPSNPSSNVNPDFEFSSNELGTFECRLDSGDEEDFAPCTSPHQLAGLAEGEHTFEVRAIDSGGNVDPTPASHTWLIDLTAPETGIDSTPPNPSPSSTADFEFSSNELASFECRLDSSDEGDFAACASPASYAGLLDGTHTFEVRALDLAGNFDPTPAAATWTIDSGLEFPEALASPASARSYDSKAKKCKGKRRGKCKRKRGGK